jgi:hypothetical protein
MDNSELSKLLMQHVNNSFKTFDAEYLLRHTLFEYAYPRPYKFNNNKPFFPEQHLLTDYENLRIGDLRREFEQTQHLYSTLLTEALEDVIDSSFWGLEQANKSAMEALIKVGIENSSEAYILKSEYSTVSFPLFSVLRNLEEFDWLMAIDNKVAERIDGLQIKSLLKRERKLFTENCLEHAITSDEKYGTYWDSLSVSPKDFEENLVEISQKLTPLLNGIFTYQKGMLANFVERYEKRYNKEFINVYFTKEDALWPEFREIANSYNPEDLLDLDTIKCSKSITNWLLEGGDKPKRRKNIPSVESEIQKNTKDYLSGEEPISFMLPEI